MKLTKTQFKDMREALIYFRSHGFRRVPLDGNPGKIAQMEKKETQGGRVLKHIYVDLIDNGLSVTATRGG